MKCSGFASLLKRYFHKNHFIFFYYEFVFSIELTAALRRAVLALWGAVKIEIDPSNSATSSGLIWAIEASKISSVGVVGSVGMIGVDESAGVVSVDESVGVDSMDEGVGVDEGGLI